MAEASPLTRQVLPLTQASVKPAGTATSVPLSCKCRSAAVRVASSMGSEKVRSTLSTAVVCTPAAMPVMPRMVGATWSTTAYLKV